MTRERGRLRRRAPGLASRLAGVAALLLVAGAGGCSRSAGPPRVDLGSPCAGCGMSIEDPRFACALADGKKVRSYDAIECLLRDGALKTGGAVFLADYDQGALRAADSMWVVQGEFHSPMGGGLAAFLDRAGAARVAAETRGRVGRLAEFDAPSAGRDGGGGTAP